MNKRLFSLLIFVSFSQICFAQAQKIEDQYFEYSQVRMDVNQKPEAIKQALALLERPKELTQSQFGNVNYHLGRLYEEEFEIEKCIPYYEAAIKNIPAYYVPYRALGFINYKKCNELRRKLYLIDKSSNADGYAKSFEEFKTISLKAAAYLEKAQACDPDEDTLKMIVSLYSNIKQNQAISALETRLKALSVNCITLLED